MFHGFERVVDQCFEHRCIRRPYRDRDGRRVGVSREPAPNGRPALGVDRAQEVVHPFDGGPSGVLVRVAVSLPGRALVEVVSRSPSVGLEARRVGVVLRVGDASTLAWQRTRRRYLCAVMRNYERGLRCQDVHAGLRNLDPNSGALAELEDTRVIGMAATLAGSLRGAEIVKSAQALKTVAAEQLDVDPLAFETVIQVLDDVGFITSVQRKGGKTLSFNENVPYHQDLYDVLGGAWTDRDPGEREQELVVVVDRLATSPVLEGELADATGIERANIDAVVTLANDADLVERVTTKSGDVILYSPFLAFEQPDVIAGVIEKHGTGQFAEEFQQVKEYQGLPVDQRHHPALLDAIANGLLTAPTVRRPDGIEQPFAAIPYVTDRNLLTVRKAVLEKALAVVSCIRCGQHFGGATSIQSPTATLRTLLDPDRDYTIGAHSSARRQYELLFRMQVVEYVPSGNWVQVRLRPTEDNLAAVKLARDLLTFGHAVDDRLGGDEAVRALLGSNEIYTAPIQTTHRERRRRKRSLSEREFGDLMARVMDRKPS